MITLTTTPQSISSTVKAGKTKEELAKLRKEMMKRKKTDSQMTPT